MPPEKRGAKSYPQDVTVRFLDDNIEYKCPASRLEPTKQADVFNVLWKDGRRYLGVIIDGDVLEVNKRITTEVRKKHRCQDKDESKQTLTVNTCKISEHPERSPNSSGNSCTIENDTVRITSDSTIQPNVASDPTSEQSLLQSNPEMPALLYQHQNTTVQIQEDTISITTGETAKAVTGSRLASLPPQTKSMTFSVESTYKAASVPVNQNSTKLQQQLPSAEGPLISETESELLVATDNSCVSGDKDNSCVVGDKDYNIGCTSRRRHQPTLRKTNMDVYDYSESLSESDDTGSVYEPTDESSDDNPPKSMLNTDNALPELMFARNANKATQSETGAQPTFDNCLSKTVTVRKSNKTSDGRRVYDKVHYCLYCKKPQKKISRHLLRKHKDECMVAEAYAFPLNSKERAIKLEYLRTQGDYFHNERVLKSEEGGELVTWKAPSTDVDPANFLKCIHCFGLFLRKDLWKHKRTCRVTDAERTKPGCRRVQAAAEMLTTIPSTSEVPDNLRSNVLANMNLDAVSLVARNDRLILKFGEKLYHKHANDKTQQQYISQKMRELGRLVVSLRDLNKQVNSLSDIIKPSSYGLVLTAVRHLTGYDNQTGTYKTPSLALKIGHSLKKCAYILKEEGIVTSNGIVIAEAERFLQLLEMNWATEISSLALKSLDSRKWNKPLILPLTEDIIKLHGFINTNSENYAKQLLNHPTTEVWYNLAKLLLAAIVLFNRRRGGEVSKILLETYVQFSGSQSFTHNDEIKQSLSQFELQLLDKLKRLEVRGKTGKKVPILLASGVNQKLELLVKTRNTVGIHDKNSYLFARPYFQSLSCIRAHDCIREFSHACGAENPAALSSTKLRKHVATISQILNLKDNEMDMLAKFLGHDIRIHREYYRLPEHTLQIAKIGKLLISMEQGITHQFRDKGLEEIQIDDSDLLEDEQYMEAEDGNSEEEVVGACSQQLPVPLSSKSSEVVGKSGTSKKRDQKWKKQQKTFKKTPNLISSDTDENDEDEPKSRKCVRTKVKMSPWTEAEKSIVRKNLDSCFILNKVPGKRDCEECISKAKGVLDNRTWKHVKYYVYNCLKKPYTKQT